MAPFIGNPLALGRNLASGDQLLWMTSAERARHLYVVGATRTGKSKQLEDCVRQDILAWPRSGCGLMLLDRHGSLYDNVVSWAAANDLSSWPIVPIDLRRDDWIVSYNPLRRRGRGEEPAVIVGNFVRAILHAWGQSNLSDTPRLVKWLEATLLVLHEHAFTLAEALQLITSPEIRSAMTSHIEDLVLRSIWESAPAKESDFQEVVESTVNRVRRFLSRRVMRATLGQNDVSLDLGAALEEGQIILVCIATEGAKIDEEDANTFGSLLLSDLWMAAKARGKRDEGFVKPFYVYLDEFQEYVTPAMAETLDQASGFGLHMTLAHQFPSQLLKSDQGRQLYNSVMANCRSKVVFQLEHNEDVQELATMLYRQEVTPYKLKNEIYTTKVMDHRIQYMQSFSHGTNTASGGGANTSRTEGHNQSTAVNWSHTDTASDSFTETDGTSEGETETFSESENMSTGHNTARSDSRGTALAIGQSQGLSFGHSESTSEGTSRGDVESLSEGTSTSTGESTGTSTNRAQTHSFGHPSEPLQGELEYYLDGKLVNEDEFKRKAYGLSLTEGETKSEGTSRSLSLSKSSSRSLARTTSRGTSRQLSLGANANRSANLSTSSGQDRSEGFNVMESRGTSRAYGTSTSRSHSDSTTHGTSAADSRGGSESRGTSTADTNGTSRSWSSGQNQSVTRSPMLMPMMGRELSNVTFETIDEQFFCFTRFLSGQRDRHCVIKLVSKPPVAVVTITVKPALTTEEWAREWAMLAVQGLSFALPMDKALQHIADRQRNLSTQILGLPPIGEPLSNKRTVRAIFQKPPESLPDEPGPQA